MNMKNDEKEIATKTTADNDNSNWSDDVCKRFIKSAKWTKEYNNDNACA